jgi:cyclopropane fatty-acyl-phospholipid synthase-like methyltransferase
VPGLEDWESVARASDDDELRERILTGFKSGKPFTAYRPTIELPAPLVRVLDFGCGAGRNFPYLQAVAASVHGFDLPPMIERCRRLAPVQVDALADDWPSVRDSRFDLIFAALVLQHIEPELAGSYLHDFARMAPAVYLLTRTDSDFGTRVLDAVMSSELFDAGVCVQVDHDPESHQLRVLSEKSVSDAAADDGAHYEVLLRSRINR